MEINNRTPPGDPSEVSLALGPDGKADGSYQFAGTQNSYIEFPNSAMGPLNVRDSMTMLCWVFYDGKGGPLFSYNDGNWESAVHMWVRKGNHKGHLNARFRRHFIWTTNPNPQLNLAGGWKFVGASYNNTSGEAKLWVDGAAVQTKNIREGLELGTQGSVRMGATEYNAYFKGRITQMQVYNLTLTQKQIQTTQKRTQ